jgi:hypothetical protein
MYRVQWRVLLVAGVAFGTAHAATMSRDDYRAARARIDAEYRDARAACDRLVDRGREVCRAEAAGKERVARAELEFNRSGDPNDAMRLALARADARYDVARERCAARAGADRTTCESDAKAQHAKAVADARLDRRIAEAKRDAANDRRDAEYEQARERCGTLAAEAKGSCLADAKARFDR